VTAVRVLVASEFGKSPDVITSVSEPVEVKDEDDD
jgi:hypothetical protein